MIYFLRGAAVELTDWEESPVILIGTAAWVANWRRQPRIRKSLCPTPGGHLYPYPFFRNPRVLGTMDGTDADAQAIRDVCHAVGEPIRLAYFPEHSSTAELLMDFVTASPVLDRWVAENTRTWDGSNAELLGVRGLGKARRETSRASSIALAERLARRRP